MLRLGGTEAEKCACGTDNPPAAHFCLTCGRPLGADPCPLVPGAWEIVDAPRFDVETDQIRGEAPRLWLSGGPGAWYVSEDPGGEAWLRALDSGSFAAEFQNRASLGRFESLEAVEATRRGVLAVSGQRLLSLRQRTQPPWDWSGAAQVIETPAGRIAGLARAPFGQFYLLVHADQRLHMWIGSGIGEWRHLASASAAAERDSWIDLATSDEGDALFWGGGLIGAFERRRRRLVIKYAPEVADLPHRLRDRFGERPAGDWNQWSPSSPLLVALADGPPVLLVWNDGQPVTQTIGETAGLPLAAICCDGAVLIRTASSIQRIAQDRKASTAALTLADVDEADEAAAAPMHRGVAFATARDRDVKVEQVDLRDRIPHPRETDYVDRGGGLLPAGPGFEPIHICRFSARGAPSHETWLALVAAPLARPNPPLQRILRIRRSESG